jgi:hypothetical protein
MFLEILRDSNYFASTAPSHEALSSNYLNLVQYYVMLSILDHAANPKFWLAKKVS